MTLFHDDPFLLRACGTAVAAAAVCAYLGVFVVLGRIVFVSIALAQAAALGVAAGFLLGRGHFLLALAATAAASTALWSRTANRGAPKEGSIAFCYCLASAATVMLLSRNPLAQAHGLDLVSGNILYASAWEFRTLVLTGAAVLSANLLFRKEIAVSLFDREFALSAGVAADGWTFLFHLTLGVLIAVSMKSAGVLLVFSSLVVPPLVALALARSLPAICAVSSLTAAAAAAAGFAASCRLDLPPAPAIVCAQCAAAALARATAALRR